MRLVAHKRKMRGTFSVSHLPSPRTEVGDCKLQTPSRDRRFHRLPSQMILDSCYEPEIRDLPCRADK